MPSTSSPLAELVIPERILFAPGGAGLSKALIQHPCGASVELEFYGAHVTSWKTANGREQIFTNRNVPIVFGKPVRGAVPICWPQFGRRHGIPLLHGFARFSAWRPVASKVTPDGATLLTMRLTENEETLKHWPHEFQLDLSVALSEKLDMTLTAMNTGKEPFTFTGGFHPYFALADIAKAELKGLKGIAPLNTKNIQAGGAPIGETLTFSEFTDLVLPDVPNRLLLCDNAIGRRLTVVSRNFPDSVVWTPWTIDNLYTEDEWRHFLCVESIAYDQHAITLSPAETWQGGVEYSAEG